MLHDVPVQEKVVTILDAIDEFIEDRESYGCKPNTIKFYRSNLRRAATFLTSRHSGADLDQLFPISSLTRKGMRAFFAYLHRREVSQSTLSAYDRVLRPFCKFCVVEGWIEENPMASRDRIKPPRGKLPSTLELEEIDRLLAVCGDDQLGVRDSALMLLMLDTGLRAGEVCSLTMDRLQFNGDRGTIFVSAAGSKGVNDRVMAIWSETVNAIERWLEIRPPGATTVFVKSDGFHLTSTKLLPDGLGQMMRRRARQAQVTGKKRWCHIWRHTFAKLFVSRGGDLETLRRLLGHSSLETVRIYLGFRTEEIEQRHFELSPVRQLFEQK